MLAICFLAVWPLLKYGSLPHDTDAELHIFRLAELQRMWAGGVFYPRWAANFYYGFGYPIFNYYAPLTYYIGMLFMLIPGVGAVEAIKLVFIVALLGAGLNMYRFVRDEWGQGAGIVSASLYVYAPYILYIDPHARGVVPEAFSFTVFPFALHMINRFRRDRKPAAFAWSIVAIACTILVHNLMAMVFGALLFGWFLWHSWTAVDGFNRPFLRDGLLLFGAGVALSAFFWLPMALEQDAIQIATVVGAGSHYDYRNHFLSISELLAPTLRLDWGATEPQYRLNLGLFQWGLALMGCLSLPWLKADRRWSGSFFAIAALLLLFLMLPQSQAVWGAIPLLPFLQFPWRLIGAASAMLAVLGGIGFVAFGRILHTHLPAFSPERSPALLGVLVVGIITAGLPLTQVAPWGSFGTTEITDVLNSELKGRWRGTTSTADFVPSSVVQEPAAEASVIDAMFAGQPSDRVNRFVLGDATVASEIVTPVHYRYEIDTPHLLILRLYLFDFPGWRATIDGVSAEITRADPEGFITIHVPIGQHTVDLQFGTTPPRQIGWVLTLLGLSVLLIGAVWLSRQQPITSTIDATAPDAVQTRPLIVTILVMIGLTLFVLEPFGLLRLESQDQLAQPAETDTLVQYQDQISLIGYTAPTVVRRGSTVQADLYWKAQSDLDDNWQVFVHLLNAETAVVAQSDKLNPGDFPTRQWPTDKYVRDPHWLTIPDDLPPGTYRLTAGLWSLETGQRLQVADPAGDWFVLREFEVK